MAHRRDRATCGPPCRSRAACAGIIDCLTLYNGKKKVANFCKTFLWKNKTLSTVPSKDYGKRFLKYMFGIFPSEEQCKEAKLEHPNLDEPISPFMTLTLNENQVVPPPPPPPAGALHRSRNGGRAGGGGTASGARGHALFHPIFRKFLGKFFKENFVRKIPTKVSENISNRNTRTLGLGCRSQHCSALETGNRTNRQDAQAHAAQLPCTRGAGFGIGGGGRGGGGGGVDRRQTVCVRNIGPKFPAPLINFVSPEGKFF